MRTVVEPRDKQRGSPHPRIEDYSADLADGARPDPGRTLRGEADRGTHFDANHERESFLAVVKEHDRRLRGLAYRLLGDRDQMDDVLQEAYLRAYRHLDEFRGDATLATWIYRITYNVCLDRLRASHPDEPVDPSELELLNRTQTHGRDPAEIVGDRQDLAAALAAIPPQHRAAVLLVDAYGYDYVTASDMLGIPSGTLASRLNNARAALRTALEHPLEREEGR